MSFIFGWYSFTIKSFAPQELELQEEKYHASTLEVRQKIFHLFWLPLFGLGKNYCLRYKGELHKAPFDIEALLRSKKVRTPWYSYFVPVVLIVGTISIGLFTVLAESLMKSNRNSREKVIYETSVTNVQTELNDLEINAYLRLVNLNQYNKRSARFIKLIDKNETNYTFVKRYAMIPYRSNENYYWETGKDTVMITKTDLSKALCLDYDSYKEKNCGFELLQNGKKYVIDLVDYFDGPVVDGDIDWEFWNLIRQHDFSYYNTVFRGDRDNKRWTFKLPLQNFGAQADLIKIENLVGKVEWTDSLPITLNSYVYLKETYVQGKTTKNPDDLVFKSRFVLQDSLQNTYEYIIKGNGSRFNITRNK